jgi:hypothetical protein
MITVSYSTDASVRWRPSRPYVQYVTSHQYLNLDLKELQMTDDLVITNTQPTICLEIPTSSFSQKKFSASTKRTIIYHVLKSEWRKEQTVTIQREQAGTSYRSHFQVCSDVQTCKTVLKNEIRLRSRMTAKGWSKWRGEKEEVQQWTIKVKEQKKNENR